MKRKKLNFDIMNSSLKRSELRKITAGCGSSGGGGGSNCDGSEPCGSSSCGFGQLSCCCCESGSWVFKKCVSTNLECCLECHGTC